MRMRCARWALVLLLAVSGMALSGCCSLARAICPVEPPLTSDTRLTRDTPNEALDYLIAGIEDRRIADIFDCLHPDFIARHGGFSLAEFTSAFDEFESSFAEDAKNLSAASRTQMRHWREGDRAFASIAVNNDGMSAVIVFQRRDIAFIKTTNDFVAESRAVIAPLEAFLRNDEGRIVPRWPVRFDGMAAVAPDEIVRLEFRREWLVHELRDVIGVRLIERINEQF